MLKGPKTALTIQRLRAFGTNRSSSGVGKIRSICVIKNEGDIIEQCLTAALEWSDQIVVLDNGSTDGGWETVQRLAVSEPRIIALGQDLRPFTEGIRIQCFRALSKQAVKGDWWVRLDADEFYADDPREFLARVPAKAFSVWSASLTYYFTDRDALRYDQDPQSFADSVPVEQKCRYYLNDMSEPRFFRHAHIFRWRDQDEGYPPVMWRRPAAQERIVVRHYRYRSPEQIQRRLDVRRTIEYYFSHERIEDWADAVTRYRTTGEMSGARSLKVAASWRERVVPADALSYDAGDGHYDLLPQFWPSFPKPRSLLRGWITKVTRYPQRWLRGRRR